MLNTGAHVVSDIQCTFCRAKVGWKYVDASRPSQHYKIGKFILEGRRTVYYGSWEDTAAGDVPEVEIEKKNSRGGDNEGELVEFDSSDEDECDELFAGVWSAESAAEIRRLKLIRQLKLELQRTQPST